MVYKNNLASSSICSVAALRMRAAFFIDLGPLVKQTKKRYNCMWPYQTTAFCVAQAMQNEESPNTDFMTPRKRSLSESS